MQGVAVVKLIAISRFVMVRVDCSAHCAVCECALNVHWAVGLQEQAHYAVYS